MFEYIKEIIFNVTGKKDIVPETDFIKDLRLNSFDIVNIISCFEERFDITVKTRDLWNLHTVKDLMDYIDKLNLKI